MPKGTARKSLGAKQRDALLETLRARFEANGHRHEGIAWEKVRARLVARPDKLSSLAELDKTGGEPDVVGHDTTTGEYLFHDCAAESPAGRRSFCYDREALDARKENKPKGSAVERAAAMGAALLTEEQYRRLQALSRCDMKTSSWLQTPPEIRKLGGAIFGDYRYGTVFVYHNGADSYYAARGFRCSLSV
jgi:hypothetical protein